jgi:hypothetical protein
MHKSDFIAFYGLSGNKLCLQTRFIGDAIAFIVKKIEKQQCTNNPINFRIM